MAKSILENIGFRGSLVLLLLLLSLAKVSAQSLEPSYVIRSNQPDTLCIDDGDFYAISGAIIFPVNKYAINKNSDFYKEIFSQLIPNLRDRHLTVSRIMLRGAASPDGPLDFNTFLGKQRLNAIYNLLSQNIQMPPKDQVLKYEDVPEDYRYLLLRMQERDDPDAPAVEEILNRHGNDLKAIKRDIRAIRHDELWNRMRREYFPELRAARVVLVVSDLAAMDLVPAPEAQLVDVEMREPVILQEDNEPWPEVGAVSDWREPRREVLAVKTNVLYDLAYMPGYDRWCPIPNIGVEYYPMRGHFTFGASFYCPWWSNYDKHKYFQVRNYQIESRYYLRSGGIESNPPGEGPAYRGLYLQAYAHLGLYSIMFDAHRGWMGEGAGAGLGVGYVLPLGRNSRWKLEFGLQAGFFATKYDPYQYECPVDPTEQDRLYYYKTTLGPSLFKKRQHHFTWLGPTGISITISYDLLFRKNKRKGVSVNRWEKGGWQ